MPLPAVARRLIAAWTVFAAVLPAGSAAAFELITNSEAALPAGESQYPERGVSRAPTVVIVSPAPAAGAVRSPFHLKITFQSHGGARINIGSVLLTYVKTPPVNLTPRVERFIGPNGIEADNAEVPPGTHTLRVKVSDTDGRSSSADFTVTVLK